MDFVSQVAFSVLHSLKIMGNGIQMTAAPFVWMKGYATKIHTQHDNYAWLLLLLAFGDLNSWNGQKY